MSQALGTVAFTLPHSAELEGQYLAGNLLADLSMKDSRVFRKEIEKIARRCLGVRREAKSVPVRSQSVR